MRTPWPPLLVRCARARQTPERLQEIRRLAERCDNWSEVMDLAESQGVAPLVYRHVADSGAEIPGTVRRPLQALYIRHRRENGVRLAVLAEILQAFGAVSIPVVVLKGPAMIALVYDDAALRPMGDLDLLVPAAQASRAQALLLARGWVTSDDGESRRHHHLPGLRTVREGVALAVEVHRDAIHESAGASLRLLSSGASAPTLAASDRGRPVPGVAAARPFRLGGVGCGLSLGIEEALWHSCHHLRFFHSKLLLVIADIVGLAEAFAGELDWNRVSKCFPLVPSILSLIDELDPLPATLTHRVPKAAAGIRDVGVNYTGWPSTSVQALKRWPTAGRLVRNTLTPPDWWLRLHCGRPAASRFLLTLRHAVATAALAARKMSQL